MMSAFSQADVFWLFKISLLFRVYSTGEYVGPKLTIFDHFCDVLITSKGIPPLIYWSVFSSDLA